MMHSALIIRICDWRESGKTDIFEYQEPGITDKILLRIFFQRYGLLANSILTKK